MIRWVLTLLTSLPLFAATGDVVSGAIMPDGWMVVLRVEGGATNGTFNFGFANATNNTFNGGQKFRLTVNSPGYDSTGATNVWAGTLYGTAPIRFATPDDEFPRVTIDGSDAVIYISLNDYVYAEDTGFSATISAGLYTSSSATNNSATITLTNNSALTSYPPVFPNWRTIPHQLITNSTMRLHAHGWNAYATRGQPLAAFKFFVTDESGDVLTNTQTRMQVDFTRGEAIKSGEYIADFDISSLTHSNLLRLDFAAYPHRGNPSSVFDTRNNTYAWPSFLPASITNFYYTNAYGSVAIASPAGTNATGKAYPSGTDPTTIPAAEYFLDGTEAANGIETNNNTLYGHADVGGGTIYYRSGSDHPFGTATAVGATPKAVVTLRPYPGDSVTWTNDAGTDDLSDRIMVDGTGGTLTISPVPNTSIQFNNVVHIHFTNVIFLDIASATAPVSHSTAGHVYYTGNLFTNWVAPLPRVGAGLTQYCTMWNNNLVGHNAAVLWMNHVGNYRVGSTPKTAFVWNDDNTGFVIPLKEYQIDYNNIILNLTNSTPASIGNVREITIGKARIQSVTEGTFATSPGGSFSVSGIGTIPARGVLMMNGTTEGLRKQYFYNDAVSGGSALMHLNFGRNEIDWIPGEATDTDIASPDAARTNNWSARWRVGHIGNIYQMITNGPTHNNPSFNGLRTYRPGAAAFSPNDWPKYWDARGYLRPITTNGNGNYRLLTTSPILHDDYTNHDWYVPFDLVGMPRGRFDPPGAYVTGNPRRGGFF